MPLLLATASRRRQPPPAPLRPASLRPPSYAQAVLFCFRLSKNAVPEEVGGPGWLAAAAGASVARGSRNRGALPAGSLPPPAALLPSTAQIVLKALKPGTASA